MSVIGILLLVVMAATAAVLLTGVAGFIGGGQFNQRYGNMLMRMRVGLQLLAVLLLGLLFLTQN